MRHFPVQNDALQRPFAEVVLQWTAGHMAKSGEFFPVFEKVCDGLSQLRVGLHERLARQRAHAVVRYLRR